MTKFEAVSGEFSVDQRDHPAQEQRFKKLAFTKMQGLGNDFMVIASLRESLNLPASQIRAWANRHFGIGFDQLLVVESSSREGVDFRYRIFNADGSEVQQCGNGARCFARYVYDKGLTDKTEIVVETASGIIVLYIDGDLVRVNMGQPNFSPAALPFAVDQQQSEYAVNTSYGEVRLGAVSMGNPHAVVLVEEIEQAPVAQLGAVLESHPAFPERVNVGFVQRVSSRKIRLRVYERGAAETLACGTGACAAMVVMRSWNQVDSQVEVQLPGGDLQIEWDGQETSPVWMTGPAVTVFEGEVVYPDNGDLSTRDRFERDPYECDQSKKFGAENEPKTKILANAFDDSVEQSERLSSTDPMKVSITARSIIHPSEGA